METPETEDKGEVVERSESVSFFLRAPGYSLKDFKVRVTIDQLRVEAPDFELTRTLGCSREPKGVKTDYRNGVLSVRIANKF